MSLPELRPVKTVRQLSVTLTPAQRPEARLNAHKSLWARSDRRMQSLSRQAKDSLDYAHPEMVPHLRLCPGEPSQLWVQVHNHCEDSWIFRLKISPSIPQMWYWPQSHFPEDESPSNESSIDASSSEEAYYTLRRRNEPTYDLEHDDVSTTVELSFRVPPDFFEAHGAIQDRRPLTIDYDGFIQVYARPSDASPGRERLMVTAPFRAVVRSPSRYANYLPQIYKEVDFISRLLKIFEESFDPSVETLKFLWAYLDPRTSPTVLLPFLAQWVGWPTDDELWIQTLAHHPLRLRQLIFKAIELYRWRGTTEGLRLYLKLYTGLSDESISIKNGVDTGFKIGEAYLDYSTAKIASQPRAYHFRVRLLPPLEEYDELRAQKNLIHTIIRQEKPAFCTYDLHIIKPSEAEQWKTPRSPIKGPIEESIEEPIES